MTKRTLLWIAGGIGLLLLVLIVFAMARKQALKTTNNPEARAKPLMGVSLSPLSFDGTNFQNFFTKSQEAGSVITWTGDWRQLKDPAAAPHVVAKLAKQYNYTPVIITSLYTTESDGDITLLDPLTPVMQAQFQADVSDFVRQYQPQYIGLGVEMNRLHDQHPAEYATFVSLFAATRAAIKDVSPDTQVFTVFQLEQLKGLKGGLFGGKNTAHQWELADQFASADMIGFTTYPGLVYKNPADIPEKYYQDIATHVTQPILFTEIGWPSATVATGWDSSEQEQADFVSRFFTLTESLKPSGLVWAFLYDQPKAVPFTSLGLIDRTGHEKLAYTTWRSNL